MPQVWQSRYSRTVHPHGRGDNVLAIVGRVAARGSPPRAWGQWRGRSRRWRRLRFTPTGVGTIATSLRRASAIAVHPHGRGDNEDAIADTATAVGSPPRAWGQFRALTRCFRTIRFTPTGVGTMTRVVWACPRLAVHPHGRGDNNTVTTRNRRPSGSPPRAWGQCSSRNT